jgi:hypothetical protein
MLAEKLLDDLDGAELFTVTFFAVRQQEREKNAGFFNPVKGQGGKEAVVQLKFDAHQVLEFL